MLWDSGKEEESKTFRRTNTIKLISTTVAKSDFGRFLREIRARWRSNVKHSVRFSCLSEKNRTFYVSYFQQTSVGSI